MEISEEVVRVEKWQGRIIAVWMMIRQQMVCVICVYGPHTGRTEAEKEAFREDGERLAGLSDGQTEISEEVVRVEKWQGRIIAVWMMIRQQMVCVICVYGPHTRRTEAEKEAFREDVERLAGLSDGQTMLFVAGDFNAHIGVVEPARGRRKHRKIWMGSKEQGRARNGGDVEEERVGVRGHVLPEEGDPQNHLQERTAQDRVRTTGGAATDAQEGEGLQSVGGRVCHPTAQTGRL